jgi:hypothetical protein
VDVCPEIIVPGEQVRVTVGVVFPEFTVNVVLALAALK